MRNPESSKGQNPKSSSFKNNKKGKHENARDYYDQSVKEAEDLVFVFKSGPFGFKNDKKKEVVDYTTREVIDNSDKDLRQIINQDKDLRQVINKEKSQDEGKPEGDKPTYQIRQSKDRDHKRGGRGG